MCAECVVVARGGADVACGVCVLGLRLVERVVVVVSMSEGNSSTVHCWFVWNRGYGNF